VTLPSGTPSFAYIRNRKPAPPSNAPMLSAKAYATAAIANTRGAGNS
jgi:hypothetical protein